MMKSIIAADQTSIILLLSDNKSIRQMAQTTGHSISAIHRLQKTLDLDKENFKGGQ